MKGNKIMPKSFEEHPAYKDEDLEIKTPEELKEAKEKAGVTTHKEAVERARATERPKGINQEEVKEAIKARFKEPIIERIGKKYEINGTDDYYLATETIYDDDGDDWTNLYLVNKDGKVSKITESIDIKKSHEGKQCRFDGLEVKSATYSPETKKIRVRIRAYMRVLGSDEAISDLEIEL